jgi:crotonobetainyl-CoA:carnitine CoA-transferase CaiB-like acyl-CoA transferase
VKQKIQNALIESSAAELEVLLNEVGVPAAKVRTLPEFLDELLQGENVTTSFMTFEQANKTIKTAGLGFTFDDGDQLITASTPTLGQHSYELLKSIGINEDQITKMLAANLLR